MFFDELIIPKKQVNKRVEPNLSKNSSGYRKSLASPTNQVNNIRKDTIFKSDASLSTQPRRDTYNFNDVIIEDNEDSATLLKNLSRKESAQVYKLRWIIILILIISSAAISFIVYFIAASAEQQEFDAQYDGASFQLMTCFDRFIERLGDINSIGIATTAHGIGASDINLSMQNTTVTNTTSLWPFVTLPSFAQRAASARELSKVWLVSNHPKVDDNDRESWERYVVQDSSKIWINEGISYLEQAGLGNFEQYQSKDPKDLSVIEEMENITRKSISYFNSETSTYELQDGPGPFLAKWQTSPTLKYDTDINVNLLHENMAANDCISLGRGVFGSSIATPPGSITSDNAMTAKMATLRSIAYRKQMDHSDTLIPTLYVPIFDNFLVQTRKSVGVLLILFDWRAILENVLPAQLQGVYAVVENTCDGNVTFIINGPTVDVVGLDDMRNVEQYKMYHDLVEFNLQTAKIQDGTPDGGISLHDNGCTYRLHLYPSEDFTKTYKTNTPILITLAVSVTFAITISMFLLYNCLVEVRQKNILNKAAQSTALVSTLFPKNIRDQLLNLTTVDCHNNNDSSLLPTHSRSRLKAFLTGSTSNGHHSTDINVLSKLGVFEVSSSKKGSPQQQHPKPIADLFQHCTVMFADIAGFTAWSSMRGPEQVFLLLQTLFYGFDQAAKRRKVFKVETIGDCYVAVTGLPEPQTNHALIMARFAMDCKQIMRESSIELQCTLGPDCCDLQMRIGLHSGPVTAGVLVGDRARFQLFGDTVNTAARMESTGLPNLIHVSATTANNIIASNKGHWIERRKDLVEVKGKGRMQTYWFRPELAKQSNSTSSFVGRSEDCSSSEITSDSGSRTAMVYSRATSMLNNKVYNVDNTLGSVKRSGLVGWFVEVLLDYIEKVMRKNKDSCHATIKQDPAQGCVGYTPLPGSITLDEVQEVIEIVSPDTLQLSAPTAPTERSDNKRLNSDDLVSDLRDFVSTIARLYGNNSFHNFEHAAHVTMSAQKLLNRLITPNEDHIHEDDGEEYHQYTDGGNTLRMSRVSYVLKTDPIAQLAIVFAAMIHDVDHRGCSNVQLVKEEAQMAARYRNRSIAEQNSLDIAWSLLMTKQFDRLRNTIFVNQEDLLRFRQILVNAVLATDIWDKGMNELRHGRWEKTFPSKLENPTSSSTLSPLSNGASEKTKILKCDEVESKKIEQLNRKTTIAIEMVLQASDISSTMQHWHVYLKWNRRLFHEMYNAFENERCGGNNKDPSTFWYQGELNFFDRYVIPLAQKLKECRVFGVYGDEYLASAVSNRNEWEEKGEFIVQEYINEVVDVIGEF